MILIWFIEHKAIHNLSPAYFIFIIISLNHKLQWPYNVHCVLFILLKSASLFPSFPFQSHLWFLLGLPRQSEHILLYLVWRRIDSNRVSLSPGTPRAPWRVIVCHFLFFSFFLPQHLKQYLLNEHYMCITHNDKNCGIHLLGICYKWIASQEWKMKVLIVNKRVHGQKITEKALLRILCMVILTCKYLVVDNSWIVFQLYFSNILIK